MPVRDPIQGLDYVGRVRVQDASAESPARLLRLSAAARIGNTESNPFNPNQVHRLISKKTQDPHTGRSVQAG